MTTSTDIDRDIALARATFDMSKVTAHAATHNLETWSISHNGQDLITVSPSSAGVSAWLATMSDLSRAAVRNATPDPYPVYTATITGTITGTSWHRIQLMWSAYGPENIEPCCRCGADTVRHIHPECPHGGRYCGSCTDTIDLSDPDACCRIPCWRCDGNGELSLNPHLDENDPGIELAECPECHGTGERDTGERVRS